MNNLEPTMTTPNASFEPQSPTYLTPVDAAQQLNLGRSAFYDLLRRSEIAHYRVGKLIRITREDLDAYLAAHRVEAVARPTTPRYARYPAI